MKRLLAMLSALTVLGCAAPAPVQALTVQDRTIVQSQDPEPALPVAETEENVTIGGLTYTYYVNMNSNTIVSDATVTACDPDAVSVEIAAEVEGVPVTGVQASAFRGCPALQEINVSQEQTYLKSIDGVLFSADGLTLLRYPSGKGSSYTVPEGTEVIGHFAFGEDETPCLRSIDLPETLKEIEYNSFSGCTGLTELILPDACVSLGSGALLGCTSLERIHFGSGFTSLSASGVFGGCDALQTITSDSPVHFVQDGALYCVLSSNDAQDARRILELYPAGRQDTSFTVADGTVTINESAIRNCKALEEIILPSSLRRIGDDNFEGCTSLRTLTIPEGTDTIWDLCKGCTALESVSLPSTLTYMGYQMFQGCTALKDIYYNGKKEDFFEIGNSQANALFADKSVVMHYTDDEPYAFYEEDGLIYRLFADHAEVYRRTGAEPAAVTVPETVEGLPVTEIGEAAFSGCQTLTSVTLPDSVTVIGNAAFSQCTALTDIALPPQLESLGNRAFYDCRCLTALYLPDSITSLGASVCSRCTSLEDIRFPEGIQKIPNSMCQNCESLEEVTLPGSVVSVGNSAFYECTALKRVTFPAGLKTLGDSAFQSSALEEVTFPDGITCIPSYCFGDTALTEVTLPASVTCVEDGAFAMCGSLQKVTILNPSCELCHGNENYAASFSTDSIAHMDGCIIWEEHFFLGVIRGYAGSTAEAYAEAMHCSFEQIDAKRGDLNGDGDISISDVIALNKYLLGDYLLCDGSLSENAVNVADTDGNGIVDTTDALHLLKYCIKLIDTLS